MFGRTDTTKKNIINLADGSIALISLTIAISLSAGIDSIVLLMIAACVRALGQGVQQPAVTSLIPFIVPEDKLLKINGLNSSLQSGINLLSPLVSTSLMSLAPLQALFLIDVVTAAIAICILYFLVKVLLTEYKTENKEKNIAIHRFNGRFKTSEIPKISAFAYHLLWA